MEKWLLDRLGYPYCACKQASSRLEQKERRGRASKAITNCARCSGKSVEAGGRSGSTFKRRHRRYCRRAYRTLADKSVRITINTTIGNLLDRYALEVISTKKPKTQDNDLYFIKKIRAVFCDMPLLAIKPRHLYQYHDKRDAKVSAKREVSLLSHAYQKAVEWGYIDKHPFKGEVILGGEKPRDRYI